MPVTLTVATHAAEPFGSTGIKYGRDDGRPHDSLSLLKRSAPRPTEFLESVLQTSVSDADAKSILPQRNGLVDTCLEAYNHHRNLVLRPDDVWLGILTQFSFYVNKHAEEMREYFVRHEGKKELVVKGDIRCIDLGKMATQMADLIQKNVVDKDLQAWIIPNFTTTTLLDTTVCSVVMMSITKAYFSYRMMLMCGIPSVTLLGEVSDWQSILNRLDKLGSFGTAHKELAQWQSLLRPVIQNFVSSFDESQNSSSVDFWSKIAHYSGSGSGPRYLSGWITAFCVFSENGEWQATSLPAEDIWGNPNQTLKLKDSTNPNKQIEYPHIDTGDVPQGWCEVDVKVELNLKSMGIKEEIDTVMVAGLIGSSMFPYSSEQEQNDTVQPFPGWWIFKIDANARTAKEAEQREWERRYA